MTLKDNKKALNERNGHRLPPLKGIVGTMLVFLSAYLVLCYIGSPVDDRGYQFASEEGALTALSSVFLSMGAAFAGMCFFLTKKADRPGRVFWMMTAGVFLFFAIDELMGMHEAMGWLMGNFAGDPGVFRNWNDVAVIVYGIVSLSLAFYFLPQILRYPRFLEFLCVAFAFFFIHTLTDSTVEPKTAVSSIIEESSKLFCNAFLSLSMFVALIGIHPEARK